MTDFYKSYDAAKLTKAQLSQNIQMTNETGLCAHKRELIAYSLQQEEIEIPQIQTISPRKNTNELPLSFAQTRLWFLDQLESDSPFHNIFTAVRLTGSLNVAALKQSLNEIVRRHENLRTTFATVDGQPVQVISPTLTLTLPVVDWQLLPEVEQSIEVQRLVTEERSRPFDLTNKPLLRATLLRLGEQEYVLLLVMHNIISDRWSMQVLIQEIAAHYEAYFTEKSTPPELSIQYADFAHWQRQRLTGEVLETQLAYWKQQLAGASPVLELPTDRPRLAVQTFQGARELLVLPKPLSESLKALSQEKGVTLFMTLLTAFKTLLYRYTSQEDILVGSAIANRNVETKDLIGLFANTLVLRTQIQGNPTFSELLEQVREMTLGAYEHQDLPFEKLVEELQPERSLSHTPLFQVMFVLENNPGEKLELPGLSITPLEVENVTAKFELTLSMEETESGLRSWWEYNTDLFDAATIKRMADNFQTLLEGIVANPQQQITQLPLLSAVERHKLLFEWNDTQQEYPFDQCFPQLFEQQALSTPNAVAVVFENQQLTYRELNNRANQLAHYLRSLGVGPDVLVGICIERSLEMMVGLLGILKAGGAYVPLDPAYPQERLDFILSDAQVSVLLTDSSQLISSPLAFQNKEDLGNITPPQFKVICLETDWENIATQNAENPVPWAKVNHLAYVIYTSGSTGKPKGVQIEHGALVNFLTSMQRQPGLTQADVLLAVTTISFDIAALELYLPLITGARVELVTREVASDASLLSKQIAAAGATVMQATPATWRMLLAAGWNGVPGLKILCGGEALPSDLVQQLLATGAAIWNMYGPTETTIWSTAFEVGAAQISGTTIPIGRPIANTQIYLLDAELQPVPIGVPGELHIGGVGLARGYLNRPELTDEKFISNPFEKAVRAASPTGEGKRLYKTGDLARYLSDSTIEYIGRSDFQVKIRGFRIELGEIEAVVSQHPAVLQTVVIVREDVPGDKRLVAYIVVHPEQVPPSLSELRHLLKQQLPDYMVPANFVFLDAMPLTPNGKVDRRALPAPDMALSLTTNFVAPCTPTQEVLANLWAEVLSLKQVGIHDNFFELGGHSLLATQVISRLRSVLEVELPLRRLFEFPTVAEFSELIEATRHTGLGLQVPAIEPVSRNADLPLSFAQTRLWFLNQLEGETATYNMPEPLRLTGSLNVVALEMAVQEIVQRHEVLRTTFKMVNGSPVQVITPNLTVTLPVVDLQHLPQQEQSTVVQRLASEERSCPFDLSNDPLLRVSLLRLGEQSHVLLLVMHHIVSDGWSMEIFIYELSALYKAFCAGESSSLPQLPIQYADFAAWQREWLSGEVLQTQLDYWKEHLAGAPPLLELPTDRPRPPVQTFQGSTQYFQLNQEVTQKLKTLSQQSGATLFMTLVAAFTTLLSRYSGQEDIVIGSPIANRTRSEIESLIGFFVNTLVLRTDLSGNPSFSELLKRVREMTLGAYDHQDLPFEKLVEELQPERSLSYSPVFQVMFVLQNAQEGKLELPGLTISSLELEEVTATDDLFVSMEETQAGLSGKLVYNTDLFDATTIERMIGHFQNLLEGIVANPQQPIAQLPLLSTAERHQLLFEYNDTKAEYPLQECFPQLFEAQVARTPDAVAVVFENSVLTYQQLNARANRWARHLVELGVGADTVVALLSDRNIDLLTAILAVFKAGGAYLPLNPHHPVERQAQVFEQSRVPLVLTTSQLEPMVTSAFNTLEVTAPQLLLLEQMEEQQHSSENLPVRSKPDNLAYVIYTSGSTGKPKGAMLEHRGMLNHLYAKAQDLHLSDRDTVAQTAPASFDISVWQFLVALLVGGQVHIIRDEIAADPAQLLTVVEHQGISILEIVPSLLRMILQEIDRNDSTRPQLSKLRWLLLTGEALPPQLCRHWLEYYPIIPMMNAYGPTECSDDVTHYPICEPPSEEMLNLPIGRAVLNTQLYVLDSQLQPVPLGVAGELYVGGVGVGRGYLHNPQQTQRAFIADPFAQQEGARLYKTGDKARYLKDGNIEFLGRIDYQVKIRGFRIELGEIEVVLSQHPSVQEAVVIAREDQPGNKRLVGYVVPKSELTVTSSELRSFLKEKLPDYMVPSAFVTLEKMPLTPNGKVDRKALPEPDPTHSELEGTFVAPRTPVEEVLADIWTEILGLEQVGIHHNFFELGGHSLLATQVISRIYDVFQVKLPLRTLFETQTVADLAVSIVRSMAEETEQEEMARILAELEELEEL
ncbi:MAG: amino acid adenylation domain-containing protein [Iphinoe sp. HA4291-MV1]|nr:amino acid adenylation domain-containing protein [Iphinoe sp. HA4291-MV1]